MANSVRDGAPLVVVVTPTYNGERYLRETMESVQAQTYPNLLHLVLDNASTDGAPAIMAEFANGRVPVRIVRNPELLPQKANWNTAFGLVPAEAVYVRLLCDDDTITPDSIEKMVAAAEADPAITVVGNQHVHFGAVQDLDWPADRSVFDGAEAVRMALLGQGQLMPMQMLWRKSAIDTLQPLFSDEITTMWDLDAVLKLVSLGKFAFIHECLGFTRDHPNTVTAQLKSVETKAFARDTLDLLRKYGPSTFGKNYPAHVRRYRRLYVRRILAWRRNPKAKTWLQSHYAAIERAGWRWSPLLVADALVAWVFQKAHLMNPWTGMPGWHGFE